MREWGDGLVFRNAAKPVKVKSGSQVEILPLTVEEARTFLAAARGDRLEALYVTAPTLGMRHGGAWVSGGRISTSTWGWLPSAGRW